MTPCQKLLKQEGTARRIESMQQSSATLSLHLWFLGVAEDCCMLSILLAVPSCFNSFWHGVIPTSYFIFNDFYTCNYRDGTGWLASLPYILKINVSVAIGTQSGIRLHKRVPMVKIWGSAKNVQNRVTILHLVVVVVLLLQFQLTYLKNRTELRNETLHTDRTP